MASERASESYLGSDSDDLTVTKVSDRHLQFLKSRILHYISQTNDFSAEIHHVRGQPAQVVFSIGTKSGRRSSAPIQTSNKLLVKNLPPSYDEQHLQMFFEYEKGQIGQPIKKLTLNRRSHSAVVEFESSRAVDIVLSKRPIKIMDNTVDVDVLMPYLEDGETLGSVSVTGLPDALGDDLIRLHLDDQNDVFGHQFKIGDRVKVIKLSIQSFGLALLGIKVGSEGTVSSIELETVNVVFPKGHCATFALSDIKRVI